MLNKSQLTLLISNMEKLFTAYLCKFNTLFLTWAFFLLSSFAIFSTSFLTKSMASTKSRNLLFICGLMHSSWEIRETNSWINKLFNFTCIALKVQDVRIQKTEAKDSAFTLGRLKTLQCLTVQIRVMD